MKKKKILAALCAVSLLISNICLTSFANNSSAEQNINIEDNEYHSGRIVPYENRNTVFSGGVDYNSLDEVQYRRSIFVNGDNISVNISILDYYSEIQLQYDGKLYKSVRYTVDEPVYIGVFENNNLSNIDVIYFEISNGSSLYNLNQNLRECASITMYLKNAEGEIYDLGCEIDTPIILEGVEELAQSDKDLNWFLGSFDGTYTDEQRMDTRNRYPVTRWYGNTHTLTYQIAGYEHKYMAQPYVDLYIGDVGATSSTEFSMSLKISESHRYRPINSSNWTINTEDYSRCFIIDHVQLTWTAGGNTVISSVEPHLNTSGQGGGNYSFWGLAAAVAGVSPEGTTLATLLSVADSILSINAGDPTEFSNTRDGGSTGGVKAYKMKFPDNYYIQESGIALNNTQAERFEFIANMSTSNRYLSKNVQTYAIADFRFRLAWAGMDGQSGSRNYEDYKSVTYYTNCAG